METGERERKQCVCMSVCVWREKGRGEIGEMATTEEKEGKQKDEEEGKRKQRVGRGRICERIWREKEAPGEPREGRNGERRDCMCLKAEGEGSDTWWEGARGYGSKQTDLMRTRNGNLRKIFNGWKSSIFWRKIKYITGNYDERK